MVSVLIKDDSDNEMMEVYVNGELLDSGNYWDFDSKDLLESVLDKLNIPCEVEDYE